MRSFRIGLSFREHPKHSEYMGDCRSRSLSPREDGDLKLIAHGSGKLVAYHNYSEGNPTGTIVPGLYRGERVERGDRYIDADPIPEAEMASVRSVLYFERFVAPFVFWTEDEHNPRFVER